MPMVLLLIGCYRGQPSEKPPIHLNPDMDDQPKYLPQAGSRFFEDGAAMRMPVEGTVARGWLEEDSTFYFGMDLKTGQPVEKSPVPVTLTGLRRGEERFNIYCSPCHSRVGDGHGIMVQRGYTPPPTFHSQQVRNYPDGHLFQVISRGIRSMPSYGQQIPAGDRWLIVNYLRALQLSQHASIEDVPEEMQDQIK